MGTSPIRFTGLASGMDTESVVKAMLTSYQTKIDKQKQNQTSLEWKRDSWKDMNSKVNSFYSNYISKLKMSTTFAKNKITTSDNNAIKVNENSSIPAGTHQVSVSQIATSAYMKNEKMTATTVTPLAETTTLKQLGMDKETTIKLQKLVDGAVVEGEDYAEFKLGPNDTIATLKDKLAEQDLELKVTEGKIEITSNKNTADNEAVKLVASEGNTNLFSKLGVGTTTLKKDQVITGSDLNTFSKSMTLGRLGITDTAIKVNGKSVEITENMTLSELESKIKEADSNLSVNLDLGEGVQRFFISSKKTGDGNNITIEQEDGGSDILKKLGLYTDPAEESLKGKNAKYTYNGVEYTSSTNDISVNGLKMTFIAETTSSVNITAVKDTESLVSFVKEFVTEYNKLIEEINTEIETRPSKTYKPLTDEQREAMSESEIEKWEKEAKKGLFYRDGQLTQIRDNLRSMIGGGVTGTAYGTLSGVGITTGQWNEKGKLYFDEAKFTKALEDDPESVIKLFTGTGDESAAKTAYEKKYGENSWSSVSETDRQSYLANTKGIFNRLYDNLNKMVGTSTVNKSYGSFYNDKLIKKQLEDMEKRLDELQDRYDQKETALYKKFTAMEKAMSTMNTQSSWLSAQLGSY